MKGIGRHVNQVSTGRNGLGKAGNAASLHRNLGKGSALSLAQSWRTRCFMSLPLFVVLGAGRSAGWLIDQLQERMALGTLALRIVDGQPPGIPLKEGVDFRHASVGEGFDFSALLQGAYCCISLLPPPLHPFVMQACLTTGTHFISASYETPFARSLDAEAKAKGLVFLNECGLDPGLDHVTALAMLARVKAKGGKVVSFESDCGGLPSRTSLNDWGYRFFWNPMNVVTAGAAGARFVQDKRVKLISTSEVFRQYRPLFAENGRTLVAYPNRDSFPYESLYGLEGIDTFIRGTIRYQDFCDRWAALAEAQVSNTSIVLESGTTFSQWAGLFLWHPQAHCLLAELINETNLSAEQLNTPWTSAEVLLHVLMKAWNAGSGYTDRVILRHRIVYELDGHTYAYTGMLDREGNTRHSAMAFTVGLPIAIVSKANLDTLKPGVTTPMDNLIAQAIYRELPEYDVHMTYADLKVT